MEWMAGSGDSFSMRRMSGDAIEAHFEHTADRGLKRSPREDGEGRTGSRGETGFSSGRVDQGGIDLGWTSL